MKSSYIKIIIISSFFLLLIILKNSFINQSLVTKIGYMDNKKISVQINNRNDYDILINNYQNLEYNILKYDNNKYYKKYSFDPYYYTFSQFDKDVIDNNIKIFKNPFSSDIVFLELNHEVYPDILGEYSLTTKDDITQLLNKLIELDLDASITTMKPYTNNLSNSPIYLIIIFNFIIIIQSVILIKSNRRKIGIFNLYSYKIDCFKYLFKGNIINFISAVIISNIISFFLFKITYNYVNGLLILSFISYISLSYILLLSTTKINVVDSIKGKVNSSILLRCYQVIISIILISINLLMFLAVGNIDDVPAQIDKAKLNWSFSKEYARITNEDQVDEEFTRYYKLLDDNGAIYLDNSALVIYESTYLLNNVSSIKRDTPNTLKYLSVNENYLDYIKFNDAFNKEIINIFIPNNKDITLDNKEDLCLSVDIIKKDIKCEIKYYDSYNIFTNSYYDSNRGFDDDIIIKYLPQSYFADADDIMPSLHTYLSIDANQSYTNNFNSIKKLINDDSFFSEQGYYNQLSNYYYDYLELLPIFKNFKNTTFIISMILFMVSITLIYLIIKTYLSLNIKYIFILKISGQNLFTRYQAIFTFILTILLLSNIGSYLIIRIFKIGYYNTKFYSYMALLYVLVVVIMIIFINYLENKSINNILKGESLK